jgi:hypothetical protein
LTAIVEVAETVVPVTALPDAGGVPAPNLTRIEAVPPPVLISVFVVMENIYLVFAVGVKANARPAITGAVEITWSVPLIVPASLFFVSR